MTTCRCLGDWCSCAGTRRLKTDREVPLPLLMKDSAMSETPTIDTMPTATMTVDEAIKLPRYAGMVQARQYAARDIAMANAGQGGNADYQAGIRDHYAEQTSNAWNGNAVNDNAPADPQFAKDGRAFADLSAGEQAHERMAQGMQDAWKH